VAKVDVVAASYYNDTEMGERVGMIVYYRPSNSHRLREAETTEQQLVDYLWDQIANHSAYYHAYFLHKIPLVDEPHLVPFPGLEHEPRVPIPRLREHHVGFHVEFREPLAGIELPIEHLELEKRARLLPERESD
jgi:hypothetical protein